MVSTTALSLLFLLLPLAALSGNTCSNKEGCHKSDDELIRRFREGCPFTSSDVKCALRRQDQIKQWLERNNKFKVLIIGKMGTGKTTLVKGLKEQFVLEEDHLEAHTVKVTPYQHEYDQVDFTFFDTPGLKDTVNGSNDYSYLEDMVRNNEQPDLIIFTVKMDDSYFRQEDKGVIGNVSDAFGWKVWRNAMFALTFANKVSKPGHAIKSRENKVHFSDVRNKFSLSITELLRKQKVQEEVASSIPVIPVGLISQPRIESDERGISWVKEFWETLFEVLKASRQEPAYQQEEEEDICNCDCSKEGKDQSSSWWCWWPFC